MRFKLHFEGGLYQIQDTHYYSNSCSLSEIIKWIRVHDYIPLYYPLQTRTRLNNIFFEFDNTKELKNYFVEYLI